jgi:nucleoside phosphorylase
MPTLKVQLPNEAMSQAATQTFSQEVAPKPGLRLCVVTAAELEFKALAGLMAGRSQANDGKLKICRGQMASHQMTLLKSEIGAPDFARRLTEHLVAASYDALLIAGLAGGLDPQLKTGDAVIYTRCLSARGATAEPDFREKRPAREEIASVICDPDLSNWLFETLRAAGMVCSSGAGLTVGRVVAEAERKLELWRHYGALAVDMETYQVLVACERAGLPATALRVVIDEADSDLPDFNRGLQADGCVNPWLTARALAARPIRSAFFFRGLKRAIAALRLAAVAALQASGWPTYKRPEARQGQ